MVNGDVSAEVIATDYEGMIKEGEELAGLNPHIVVKVPLYRSRNQGNQVIFSGKGHPYELYACLFSGTGIVGGQSGCDVCFSFCRPFGRHCE